VHAVARADQLVEGLGIRRPRSSDPGGRATCLEQDDAARLEFAGAHAAEQHLLVEGDHQVGLVAAVGDGPEPMRMRLPLAPATLRAGGWISAGMISTVQTPLPMRAAIAASDWPQRCAPSPESLTISTMCSVERDGRLGGGRGSRSITDAVARSWSCASLSVLGAPAGAREVRSAGSRPNSRSSGARPRGR
jgi:hypothetical protein